MKPRLLDLCCKAGGSSKGYADAGFEVWGLDMEPQPNYVFPERFILADALSWLPDHYQEFDAVAASPHCQGYSRMTRDADKANWDRTIPMFREAMIATGLPWVIENVEGAAWAMRNPVKLCGSMFQCPIFRHRLFETSFGLIFSPYSCRHDFKPILITDHGGPNANGKGKPRKRSSRLVKLDAMGIDWYMNDDEVSNAVPPVYTEWIGRQLLSLM